MGRRAIAKAAWAGMMLVGCARSAILDGDADVFAEPEPVTTGPGVDAAGAWATTDGGLPLEAFDSGAPVNGYDAGPSAAQGDASPVGPAGPTDAAVDAGPRTDAGAKTDAGTDAGSGTDAGQDAGPVACPTGAMRCGDTCVDLTSDSAHCGSCTKACGSAEICNASACVRPAPTGDGCTAATSGSHNYYVCTKTQTWSNARKACISYGMDLAIPNDAAENTFLRDQGGAMWIGVNDLGKEGTYVGVPVGDGSSDNGPAATYTRWKSGEPNNSQTCYIGFICLGADEDCEQLNDDGTWNDARCSGSAAYACESY